MNALSCYSSLYKNELFDHIIPFWLNHSKDEQHGGYFTSLDRYGKVFDTDKFIWLQGREVWLFSMLYNNIEQRKEWLDMAVHGAEFMRKYGRDPQGNWYFSLTRDGRPLIQPYNIFSDCFAAMGFAALSKATGNTEYTKIAEDTFNNIIIRSVNPKGKWSKGVEGSRPLKNFALPMILCNLSLELEHIIGSDSVNEFAPQVIHEVMDVFYQPDKGLILENVYQDGSFSDSYEGRLLNPGHAIEAMWFIMDLGARFDNKQLINQSVEIMLKTLDHGWDKEFGGIFYFMDVLEHPVQQLEWDQKLWWVHMETLVSLAKAYKYTGNEDCKNWFEKVHEYTWTHFRDTEYDEWFGYLNRRGEVLLSLKGGKWKGCFHVPRGLYQVWETLEI